MNDYSGYETFAFQAHTMAKPTRPGFNEFWALELQSSMRIRYSAF